MVFACVCWDTPSSQMCDTVSSPLVRHIPNHLPWTQSLMWLHSQLRLHLWHERPSQHFERLLTLACSLCRLFGGLGCATGCCCWMRWTKWAGMLVEILLLLCSRSGADLSTAAVHAATDAVLQDWLD